MILLGPIDDLALVERGVPVGGVVERDVVGKAAVLVVELDRESLVGRDGHAVLVELVVGGSDRQRGAIGGAGRLGGRRAVAGDHQPRRGGDGR